MSLGTGWRTAILVAAAPATPFGVGAPDWGAGTLLFAVQGYAGLVPYYPPPLYEPDEGPRLGALCRARVGVGPGGTRAITDLDCTEDAA